MIKQEKSQSKERRILHSKEKQVLVILDAHAILHRAFHALPAFTSPQGEPTGALYGFIAMLVKIIRELKPDYLVAGYDLPKPTFRHIVYENYKAQRPKTDNGLILQIEASRNILKAFGIPIYEKEGFEADDIIGTIVEQSSASWRTNLQSPPSNLKIIIASGDLDTLQLVKNNQVVVYTLKKGLEDTIVYDEKAVEKRFGFQPELLPDFKGLKGDPSDNIIGIQGIGEKTASELIQNFGSLENLYKILKQNPEKLLQKGIKPRIVHLLKEGEEDAFFSKELAQIRKDVGLVFDLKKSFWREGFNGEKLKEILFHYGFASLIKRIFENNQAAPAGFSEGEKAVPPKAGREEPPEKLKIALWLIDSRFINPSWEDIFAFTRTSSPIQAEKELLVKIKEENLEKVFYEIELPLVDILKKMEGRGLLVDIAYSKKLSGQYHQKLEELGKKIWRAAGEKFNINSPQQLAEILFEKLKLSAKGLKKTGQGARSTRFSELSKLADSHPVIKSVLAYRELAKLVFTYIDVFPKLADQDGRIHTKFIQTGTATGRLASKNPNLQNLPTRSEFGRAVRRCFVAPAGKSFLSLDYSQIELRIAAGLSADENLREAFLVGEDIHLATAGRVFRTAPEKITVEMRRQAKILNFGILYGMGVNSFAREAKISREEAEVFYQEYFKNFSQLVQYLDGIKKQAEETGYVQTLFGRKRRLPEIHSSIASKRAEAERMAVNHPIQGTASDIIKIAMIEISDFLKENYPGGISLVLQIHDELLFEVNDNIMEEAAPRLKKIMAGAADLSVPLVVNVSKGGNFRDLKP
ncbi:MAG: polymerase protein [Parcubacteria group bacterium GW2011_GWB1_41_6]|nr:MAG: polymerase protein [Parcubacteria group bacterium GW2011_GWB1_41_6]KKS71721.1 MAG: polymerase protein [Parcubacteria group bacterium GW2011_GWF2_42_7]